MQKIYKKEDNVYYVKFSDNEIDFTKVNQETDLAEEIKKYSEEHDKLFKKQNNIKQYFLATTTASIITAIVIFVILAFLIFNL